jgi:hypothetical protein
MGRQHIAHHATTSADPATVYALLRDGASWPSWSPIDAFELERQGDSEPEGVGAVRVLRSGRVTGRDTIVELVPDRRLSYTHVSSLPVRDYRGDIDLTPVAGGTEIRWATSFEPKYPGTGGLLRRGLGGFIGRCTEGLAARATELAGGAQRDAA